jgi:hypothetical protein
MMREVVDSRTVVSIGYDALSETLEIEFKSGSVYQYYNVSESLYTQLTLAPSKGQFVNIYIRNAYPFSRVG